MTQFQFYSLLVTAASAAVTAFASVVAVLVASLTNNKRLDDTNKRIDETNARIGELKGDMNRQFERVNLTLEAIRQDMADFRARLSAHDEAIETLKKRNG